MSSNATSSAEAITLPKGGGAMQGIGEKFSPDLHTGTGNFSIPIALPPGRNGLQPQLVLGYSTGSGNGPFGLGWSLGVPSISRKTSRGVPRYRDGAADPALHDTFVLSGAEDLVPVPGGAEGAQRYRPRTDGAFARIERHRGPGGGGWEVRTRDGMVSRYGISQDAETGAATLADPAAPGRVFAWKLVETEDPFGNRVRYEYLHDRGSDDFHHWDQLYLRRILYADHGPAADRRFLVSVEFEYGERPDPFSDHRAGFEVRTRLRCERILVRTHADQDRLTRSYRFVYLDQIPERAAELPLNGVSLLCQVDAAGHDGAREEHLPPLRFDYTRFRPDGRDFFPLRGTDLPARSLAAPGVELVDLFGTGLPDLVETGETVRYWRNRGGGCFDLPRPMADAPAGYRLGQPGVHLMDANGDGRADLLVSRGEQAGYFPLRFGGTWDRGGFRPYAAAPTFDLRDPEVRLVDLDGDGVTDAIRSGRRLECFFNDPHAGWSETIAVERRRLALFPDVTFSDARVRFADMSGDGLQDMVLLHDGAVEYWPAMGWGDWGRKVTMRGAPRFPHGYDPARVLLGDVDGDGCADLVYLEDTRITLWINRAGNGWSAPIVITGTPPVSDPGSVRLVDLLGTGIAGILWSADAGVPQRSRFLFLQLAGPEKPYLLNRMDNRTGAVTTVEYAPSTRFYLADQAAPETRWRTPLPFPVQVVARTEVRDQVSGGRLVTTYRYRHGYWDGAEREFRGFARVDQRDAEAFDAARDAALPEGTHAPPVETRTWFHLGPVGDEHGEWEEIGLEGEFWGEDPRAFSRPAEMEALLDGLPRRARRDAIRALRGRTLRTEVYTLDAAGPRDRPYTVTEALHAVREEDAPDPDGPDRERVFFPHTPAERTTQWDRGTEPMTRLSFSGRFDAYGQPRASLAVAVPRGRNWRASAPAGAEPYLATLAESEFAVRDQAGGPFLVRPSRATEHEVPNDGAPDALSFAAAVLRGEGARRVLAETLTFYDGPAFQGLPLGALGAFGAATRTETLVLTEEILRAAYAHAGEGAPTPALPAYLVPGGAPAWTDEYPAAFRQALPALAGYVHHPAGGGRAGGWYASAGKRYDFHDSPSGARGLVRATRDALGNDTTVAYDAYALLPAETRSAAGLATRAVYDYRAFQPGELTDPNGNRARMAYTPLGLPEAHFLLGREGEEVGDTPDAPSVRFSYDFLAFHERGEPVSVRTVRRVHHARDTDVPAAERDATITSVEFSDGFGRLVQTRGQAEDVVFGDEDRGDGLLPLDPSAPVGSAVGRVAAPSAPRVIVSGAQLYDNKGRVVEAYEPRFRAGWGYEPPRVFGRKTVFRYDAAGRVVRTVAPDGSEQRTVYGVPSDPARPDSFRPTPWETYVYDAADNAERTHPDAPEAVRRHHDTPTSSVVDALGRVVAATVRNGPAPEQRYTVRTRYDVRGRALEIRDELGRRVLAHVYDLAGHPLRSEHIDAGVQRFVLDAGGNPVERRDPRGALALMARDRVLRPTRTWARDDAAGATTLREVFVYGDELPAATARAANLLGRPYRHYDEAGVVTVERYDFAGNVVEKLLRTLSDAEVLAAFDPKPGNGYAVAPYRVDWQPPAGTTLDAHAEKKLEAQAYRTSAAFDALGRSRWTRLPTDVEGKRRTLRPRYNRAGALEGVDLEGAPFVERIAYDALGRRTLVVYGNGYLTRHAHHPLTTRLARTRTERYTRGTGPVPTYAPAAPTRPLQDVFYTHDLAGNVLRIEDRTPRSGVSGNPEAPAETDPVLMRLLSEGNALVRRFEYDALYRLLSATGRRCRTTHDPRPIEDARVCGHTWSNLGNPSEDNAPILSTLYRETYRYDAAGNLTSLRHATAETAWTRRFGIGGMANEAWEAAWPAHLTGDWNGAPGNRLTHFRDTDVPAGPTHRYDAAGNLVQENTSRRYTWDHAGRLALYRTQADGAKPTAYGYYLYDASGARVKKLSGTQGGPVEVTVYVDGLFEHRRLGTQQCNSIHVMDGASRIAEVRVGKPLPGDNSPPVQYHLGDHLGSSVAVVDGDGASVNREEFTPYGETVLGAYAKKRYRFTGKERDEESGLSYHGARYYAPWLCRWTAPDPAGPVDGFNLYAYVRNNPLALVDSGGRAAGVAPALAPSVAQGTARVAGSALARASAAWGCEAAVVEGGAGATVGASVGLTVGAAVAAVASVGLAVYTWKKYFDAKAEIEQMDRTSARLAEHVRRQVELAWRNGEITDDEYFGFRNTGTLNLDLTRRSGWREGALPGRMVPPRGTPEFSRFAQSAFQKRFSETPELQALWDRAAAGLPCSKSGFAQAREEFWNLVNNDTSSTAQIVRDIIQEAGYVLQGGSLAPLLAMSGWDPQGTREVSDRRLSIDHADAQSMCTGSNLRCDNLRFMSQRDNSSRGNRFDANDQPRP